MNGMEGVGAESAFFQKLHGPENWDGGPFLLQQYPEGRPVVFALKSTYGAGRQIDDMRTTFIDEVYFPGMRFGGE